MKLIYSSFLALAAAKVVIIKKEEEFSLDVYTCDSSCHDSNTCHLPGNAPNEYKICDTQSGKFHTKKCPEKTLWNHGHKKCDWIGRPLDIKDFLPDDFENVCDFCPDDVDYMETSCYYALPNDNTHYIQCSNGTPYRMSCPEGLVWNQDLEVCVMDYGKAAVVNSTDIGGCSYFPTKAIILRSPMFNCEIF